MTGEKNFFPTADDIKMEAQKKELHALEQQEQPGGEAGGMRMLLEAERQDSRERSSSEESWEKVGSNSEEVGVEQASSDC